MDVKPGVDRAQARSAVRRGDRRLRRQGPDRGRTAARGDAAGLGPDRRARTGRRHVAARARRWPKGCSIRAIRRTTRRTSQRLAALTPAKSRAALQRWLTRPAYTLAVVPGERTEDGAHAGRLGRRGTPPAPPPTPAHTGAASRTGAPRAAPAGRSRSPTWPSRRSSTPRCRTASRSRSPGARRSPRSRWR